MGKNIITNLFLTDEAESSQLKKSIYEEELKKINNMFSLNENVVDIKQMYYVKNDDNLEFSFFIRNGLNCNVALENIALVVEDKDGKEVLSKKFNFKNHGNIAAYSASPFTVNFELDGYDNFDEKGEYRLVFGKQDSIESYSSVSTEIENIPLDIPFEEEQGIRDFLNGLKTLEENQVAVSIYKFTPYKNKGINCILLLRNGYDKPLNLDQLPLSIVDKKDTIIFSKVFENENGIFHMNPKAAKIVNLEFSEAELSDKTYDISEIKVIIK